MRLWILYFLDAFAELRNSTIAFVMFFSSICLSVRMEQLGSYWTEFMKFDICVFFGNLSEKF
jgi:hypothetical protein